MSDRLEELGVPHKLLAAIRNEVRTNIEQQLNDLWMVVHSIKNDAGKADSNDSSSTTDPAVIEELKDGVSRLTEQIQNIQSNLDTARSELTKKIKSLSKRTRKLAQAPVLSQETPTAAQVKGLQDKLDKLEREASQLGTAAALFENRLADQESRLFRRLDDSEHRVNRSLANLPREGMGSNVSHSSAIDELSTDFLLSLAGTVDFSLADLAKVPIRHNASDLILRPNSLPFTYLEGELIPIGQQVLTASDTRRVVLLALTLSERQQLVKDRTFSKLVEYHNTRFVLNAYFERGELGAYLRGLTPPPLSLDQLDLPRSMEVSLLEDRGLILLCGGSMGSLKEVAYALLLPINRQRRARIFTLEEAVCYELPEEQSLLSQLQRGLDINQTSDLIRLKPDVLMLQRIANGEELQVALSFASDKTLVIACCPGSGVINCVEHLIELTSPEHRGSILAQLGASLRSILCYRGSHASEYLLNSAKVRPWLERGDLTALQTAVENNQPSKARAVSPPPAIKVDNTPLPPPSTESLSAVPDSKPPAPPSSTTPIPSIRPPQDLPPGPKAAGRLQPPPADTSPPEEKSGGDEETLLGWL